MIIIYVRNGVEKFDDSCGCGLSKSVGAIAFFQFPFFPHYFLISFKLLEMGDIKGNIINFSPPFRHKRKEDRMTIPRLSFRPH